MSLHPSLEKHMKENLSETALKDPSVQAFVRSINNSCLLPGESLEGLKMQISERKSIEKELNRTANLLVTLLTSLHSGILAEDEERKVLFSNDLFCEMFGIPANAESLKGKDCLMLAEQGKVVFRDPDGFIRRINEIVRNKETVVGEEIQLADGQYLERDFIPLYVHNNYKGHLWHYRNITDRKKDENRLVESNEKLQLLYNLINNTSDAIQAATEDGTIFYINQEASLRLGIPQDKITGYHVSAIETLFKDPEAWKLHVEEVKQKGCLSLEGEHFNHSTGQKFPVEVTVRYVSINNAGYLIANSRDITNRKSTEKLLRAQEEKYRNIIANMNLGLVEVDNNEIIKYTNHGFQVISGYREEELVGKNAGSLFVMEKNNSTIEDMMKNRRNGVSDMYEICVKNKLGEKRWWMISGAPNYNDKNELIGSIGIHLDITAQKNLAIDLELAKTKAEQASKAKEAFLANMSHEIRTPLNAIKGMLRELNREDLSGKQSSYVNNGLTASKHLMSIINNILDISKIEAGELNLEREDFMLQRSLDNIFSILNIRALEKNIYLKIHVSDEICSVLIGDSVRIEQILLNLIGNAIKFTSQGGVEVNCSLVNDSEGSQTIEFAISDTGIGMEPDYLKTIFSKFSQEDKSISRKFGGTGLGMAITNELVQLMKGGIEINSQKGLGTTSRVTLTLPKGNPQNIRTQQITVSDKELQNVKVLLVEDNDMNRLVAQNTLSHFGCLTSEVTDGTEAIELLKKETFDVILMDIQMPGMDGIEAARIIRNELKISTPIIALTANAFKTEVEKCRAVGMNDYVTKPFNEIQLVNAIAKLLLRPDRVARNSTSNVDEEAQNKLYDLTALEKMSRGDRTFVLKMISLFIEQTEINSALLKKMLALNNYPEISRIAHKIKPGIENMGILSLSEKVKELEFISRDNVHPETISNLVTYISDMLEKVVKQLSRELESEGHPDIK